MTSFRSALAAAVEYAQANPYQVSGFAIQAGCVIILGPGGAAALPLEVIGFSGAGPVGGSLTAWWQSTSYGAFIPAGSIFSACQAIGMKATWFGTIMPSVGTLLAMIPGHGSQEPAEDDVDDDDELAGEEQGSEEGLTIMSP